MASPSKPEDGISGRPYVFLLGLTKNRIDVFVGEEIWNGRTVGREVRLTLGEDFVQPVR